MNEHKVLVCYRHSNNLIVVHHKNYGRIEIAGIWLARRKRIDANYRVVSKKLY